MQTARREFSHISFNPSMIQKDVTPFSFGYLGYQDIHDIVALQDAVHTNLKEQGNPRRIVKRSQEYFLEHLSSPHAMYGIKDKGILIAQGIFRVSDKTTQKELCIEALPGLEQSDRLSVAQGVLVHPDYQGQGLMPKILSKWFAWCEENNIYHLAARTERSHDRAHPNVSTQGFLKEGFNKVAVITDPSDNANVNVLHKNTFGLDNVLEL